MSGTGGVLVLVARRQMGVEREGGHGVLWVLHEQLEGAACGEAQHGVATAPKRAPASLGGASLGASLAAR